MTLWPAIAVTASVGMAFMFAVVVLLAVRLHHYARPRRRSFGFTR